MEVEVVVLVVAGVVMVMVAEESNWNSSSLPQERVRQAAIEPE